MIHNIKFPDGTIRAVDFKLGSGIKGQNGNEIFEGTRVKVGCKKYTVEFDHGTLCIDLYPIKFFADGALEIVND